ncbi:MAG: signal peptidase II [Victivallaceae bacterium]|nr:signal peptidase II [Victivallaceae bacterium]
MMDLHEGIAIVNGWFDFLYVRNIGAAWSILSGHGIFLLCIGLTVATAIIAFFRHIAEGCAERYYALCLMLGGIFGNCIDRMFRGYVIDFISLHYHDIYYYPVFNVADMGICIGALILAVSGLCRKTVKPDKN